MARARNIKPGFFSNDLLAEVEPLGRILFAGLWTVADKEGRLEDRIKKIKAQVLPYDDCDCDALLQDLHKHGFILRYLIGENRFIQIVKWTDHQNPHVKEVDSSIPAPDKNSTSTVQEQVNAQPKPERVGLIPDSLNPITDSLNRIPLTGLLEKPYVEPKPLDNPTQTIFSFWQKVMASPGSVLDKKRIKFIRDALKNYSPADVCKAIRGCSKSPHNMGDNKQKTKYNGLNLILRDADHIDRFIALDAGNARPTSETIEQTNARVMSEFLGSSADDSKIVEMES